MEIIVMLQCVAPDPGSALRLSRKRLYETALSRIGRTSSGHLHVVQEALYEAFDFLGFGTGRFGDLFHCNR